MKYNPTNLNYKEISKASLKAIASETFRKTVPGVNNFYSEEGFVKFERRGMMTNSMIKLHTYRENLE